MHLRREIQIVDGGEQEPRLADDFLRPLAVRLVGGAEILAFDDLREADNRSERRLDLVDQLAKRVGVGEKPRGAVQMLGASSCSRKAIPR